MRKNAAEAVKREQERRAGERREMLLKRCGQAKNLDGLNAGNVHFVINIANHQSILSHRRIEESLSRISRSSSQTRGQQI